MGNIFRFKFKSVDLKGSGASYDVSSGKIVHPPKGKGHAKVKSKTVKEKGK
jgi:nitrite reductase/ring-hydroxylating ferredoxin subunit